MEPRKTKAAVHYGRGMPSAHCGICEHFVAPHSCEKVEGRIAKSAWCEMFRKKEQT